MLEINKGVKLYYLPTKKFNKVLFILRFSSDLDTITAAYRTIIGNLLEQTNNKYSTKKDILRKFTELDNTQLSIYTGIHGKKHWINVVIDCIENEEIVAKAVKMLIDIIFDNKLLSNELKKEYIISEFHRLNNELIGVYDNKEIYPLFRAQELYYENSEYNTLTSYGDLNALKDVNQNILSEYYYQILNEDQIDFLVTGNINSQKIFELCKLFPFTPKIKDDGIKNVIVPNNNCSLVLNKKEVQKNIQSKLIMIFNTYTYFIDSDYFELLVFNALFGSTPNSRLSYRIRTCESWAYYIFTNIDPFKGMIVLQTGISKNIKAKLEKIILEELKIIQSEKFSIGDLKKAKEIVKFQHALLDDDIASNLENSYLFKKYRNTVWNIDEFNSEIDSIRSSSIAKIANKIELHTSLFLEGQ